MTKEILNKINILKLERLELLSDPTTRFSSKVLKREKEILLEIESLSK